MSDRSFHTFKALVFDLDGTLVDSEALVAEVMKEWCKENDIEYSTAKSSAFTSRAIDTIAVIAPHLDAAAESMKIELREADASADMEPISGALDFVSKLPTDRWAVATSSTVESATAKLAGSGFPSPEILIASASVENGKPHPEPYLLATSRLGFPPDQCLAFEDSATGIQSAVNAGCSVIVVGKESSIESPQIIASIESFDELELEITDKSLGVTI